MRIEDAPPPGWYPDPQGSARLRYWEGTDWTDRFRARPPSVAPGAYPTPTEIAREAAQHWTPDARAVANAAAASTQAVVEQVRLAARAEAERAAQLFGQEARSVSRDLQPLISEYTSKITRWLRIAAVVAIVLVVAWVLWQVFVQASLFEWIGDRIDGLTDDASSAAVAAGLSRST